MNGNVVFEPDIPVVGDIFSEGMAAIGRRIVGIVIVVVEEICYLKRRR